MPKSARPKSSPKPTHPAPKRSKKATTQSKRTKKLRKLLHKSRAARRTPLGTSAFRALRNKWYAKLGETGFSDVEHTMPHSDDSTHYLQNGSLSAIAKRYNPHTLHYYRRWSTYLAHCKHNIKSKKEQDVLQLYSDGVSYRDIRDQLKPKYKRGVSINAIHFVIKHWLAVMIRWNKTSQHGLDFEADLVPA